MRHCTWCAGIGAVVAMGIDDQALLVTCKSCSGTGVERYARYPVRPSEMVELLEELEAEAVQRRPPPLDEEEPVTLMAALARSIARRVRLWWRLRGEEG